MTRKTIFVVATLAATALGSTAFAASDHGHKGQHGQKNAQGMMQGGGAGMMEGMSGMMDMMKRMHENMKQMMDADGDGKVTPEEMRTQMQAKLTENDADGDGSLSINEFETLHSAMMREMMVDRFQHLDADGDGSTDTITTTTNAAGEFGFESLFPGTYTLTEIVPAHVVKSVNKAPLSLTINAGDELAWTTGAAGLPPVNDEIREAWTKEGGVRRPVTLQGETQVQEEAAPTTGDDEPEEED